MLPVPCLEKQNQFTWCADDDSRRQVVVLAFDALTAFPNVALLLLCNTNQNRSHYVGKIEEVEHLTT